MNDFKSIHIQVKRALSSYSGPGRLHNVRKKSISVDLPLSDISFKRNFLDKFPPLDKDFKLPMKFKLTGPELEQVFGKEWYIVYFRESKTRIRVLGDVDLYYRKKIMPFHR